MGCLLVKCAGCASIKLVAAYCNLGVGPHSKSTALMEVLDASPSITYMAVNAAGELKNNQHEQAATQSRGVCSQVRGVFVCECCRLSCMELVAAGLELGVVLGPLVGAPGCIPIHHLHGRQCSRQAESNQHEQAVNAVTWGVCLGGCTSC